MRINIIFIAYSYHLGYGSFNKKLITAKMKDIDYLNYLFVISVNRGDHWQIYHRLTELEIPCKCSTGKPLEVNVETPTAALQVWSVTRQQQGQRKQIVGWLDRCFEKSFQAGLVYV